jgi:hypothetical protein
MPATNFSYQSGAAAMVFGVYLSAQAIFRIDRKSPAIRTCVLFPKIGKFKRQHRNSKQTRKPLTTWFGKL